MSSVTRIAKATLADLERVEGKAELIAGEIVPLMPTGIEASAIVGEIFVSLRSHVKETGQGRAFTDNIGFAIPELSTGRESFSPDVSYYDGPLPANPRDFVPGPPTVAVEVRNKNDFGPAAEVELAAKRAEYFEAGTKVVWDVDPEAACVRCYRPDTPDRPMIFPKGQFADAEPAVPGWRMAVDEIFA